MKILFILSMTSLIRHFEGVVLALAKRGHTIRIATPGHDTNWPMPEALAAHSRISEARCPAGRSDQWAKAVANYRAVGATHLAFNTMKTGFTSVQQHIDALRAFKAAI